MNVNNGKTANNESHHGAELCQSSFGNLDHEVVNSHKCNQRPFSTSDLWNIQKQKKKFTVGSTFNLL